MPANPMSDRPKQPQADLAFILDRVDNAIALFDATHRLIQFNRQFRQIWDLPIEWLQTQPDFATLCDRLQERGDWDTHQRDRLQRLLDNASSTPTSVQLHQVNDIYLHVEAVATERGHTLLTIRDTTGYQRSQASLQVEVKRLRFLLGLTERLQASIEVREIGEFALSYLIDATNAAFGDVKVIHGNGYHRYAQTLSNDLSSQFIATYGKPAILKMQALLDRGIPYGQGLLWEVVETGQPRFVENYHQHPQAVEAFRHPEIGQLGIFPIPASDGSILGVLTLESRSLPRLQQAPQQDMLVAACQTLGAAIERAQVQENLQQVNRDLERASQLKSEFLASMSHELRTPLNGILGFSELLLRQTQGVLSDRQLNHLRAIEQSGQHLLELINDILDLSKIEAGKVELDLEAVEIPSLCDECLRMVQPRADAKQLQLSLQLDYRLDRVVGDPRRMRQMAINLLSNAIKFTPRADELNWALVWQTGARSKRMSNPIARRSMPIRLTCVWR